MAPLARSATWRRHSCLQRRDSSRRFRECTNPGQREWFSRCCVVTTHDTRVNVWRRNVNSYAGHHKALTYDGMTVKRGNRCRLDFLIRGYLGMPRSKFFFRYPEMRDETMRGSKYDKLGLVTMPRWRASPASVAAHGYSVTPGRPFQWCLKTWSGSDYQRGDGLVSLVA